MSRFLLLNFKDFGLNQDITQTIQSQTLLCICCLQKDVPLINLMSCKHAKFLDKFVKPQLESSKKVVCYECHTSLRKIDLFSQQVQQSFDVLLESTNIIETENLRKTNFKKNKIVDIFLPPERFVPEPETSKTKVKKKNNIKEKNDFKSESQTPGLPAILIKSEPKEVKIEVKNVVNATENKLPMQNSDHQPSDESPTNKTNKVKVVKLSKGELMAERNKMLQSETYLRHPYKCENCIIGFTYEENIKDHIERKHGPKVGSVTCDICLSVLYPPGSLNVHYFRHLTRYDCERCNKRFNTFDECLHHYNREHATSALYSCRHCSYSTDSHNKFKYHRFKHKKYTCKECGLELSGPDTLKKHMIASHKRNRYACVACRLQCKTWRAYQAHARLCEYARTQHKYKCSECDMTYPSSSLLRTHREHKHATTHSNECMRCFRIFDTEEELKKHSLTHSKKRKVFQEFICDLCDQAYITKNHLINHITTHTKKQEATQARSSLF